MPHVLITPYCNVCRNSQKATEYAEVNKYLHVRSQLMCVQSSYCTTYVAVVTKINTGWSVVLNLAHAGWHRYVGGLAKSTMCCNQIRGLRFLPCEYIQTSMRGLSSTHGYSYSYCSSLVAMHLLKMSRIKTHPYLQSRLKLYS